MTQLSIHAHALQHQSTYRPTQLFCHFHGELKRRGKSFSWTLTDKEGDKNQSDLESCSWCLTAPFPFYSHVSGAEFYCWLGVSGLLQIYALRQEIKQHRRYFVLGAARTKTTGEYIFHSRFQESRVNFFFSLTCIAKMLQVDLLWQIRNSLLIQWEILYRAVLPVSVGFHTTEAGIVS